MPVVLVQYERTCGPWATITGIVGFQNDGHSVEQQTRVAMETLKASLEKRGLGTSDVATVCLYVSNMQDFTKLNSVYKTYFCQNPPIRVCVEVCLPVGVALQLDCVAHSCQSSRETMHVQGVSHWAPANIGPYSQTVRVGPRIYVAGQIALVPGSMRLVAGGITPQARLSLRHVRRVLQAAGSCDLSSVRQCVCYVTNRQDIEVARSEWARHREGEVSDSRSLCVFVVVPRLPRDALIEWQVSAWQDGAAQVEVTSSSSQSGVFTASCVCLRSVSDTDQCVSFTASVACQSPSDEIHAQTALTLSLKVLRSNLSKLQGDAAQIHHVTDNVTSLRIFYSTQFIKDCAIFTAFPSCWCAVFGDTPPLPPVFVPVCGLEGECQILAISH